MKPHDTPHPSQAEAAAAPHTQATAPPERPLRPLWLMLLALIGGFALSQAFRTVTSTLALGLQSDFGLSAQDLGAFAGLFGLSFGVAQLLMGISLDKFGLRRTILSAFPLAALGAALSAVAPSYLWLMLGQLLIGIGCAPAFLVCTLFVARHFPPDRFAFYSGLSLGGGGLGLLFTGTPLAWVVQSWGWRGGFALLALLCVLAWLLIWRWVHEPPSLHASSAQPEGWGEALMGFLRLFTLPHTWGILLLGLSSYAAFLSLRGLWLGPLLIDRFAFSLVEAGNVALAMSFISLFTPGLFGKLDPGVHQRRAWLGYASLLMASLFVILAFLPWETASVVIILCMGVLSGYGVLQYSDVRISYPPELIGRALSLFTMAMFLGVALMQAATGIMAELALQWGWDSYRAVLLTIALWLGVASVGYRYLPISPLLRKAQQDSKRV